MEFETVKYIKDTLELDVLISPAEQTAWLSKEQMALLYSKHRSAISRQINKIYKEGELEKGSSCAKIAHEVNGQTHYTEFFNLNVIVSVGNRTKSQNGLLLKEWVRENFLKKSENIIVYNNDGIRLDVTIEPSRETVWLSATQMASLFDTSTKNIYKHIKNIYQEGEIDTSVVNESLTTEINQVQVAIDGKSYITRLYNLDVILAVGYRIKGARAIQFRRWATTVLKDYLLKGYAIDSNRTLVTNENYINLINKVDSLDNRLKKIEDESVYFPKNLIIKEDKVFDALTILSEIISKANKEIVLIDPYTSDRTLNLLKYKKDDVTIKLITSDKGRLSKQDVKIFNSEHAGLSLYINNKYHDRYLIIDDLIFYHLGSSINYLGNKFSQIDKIEDEDIKDLLRSRVNEQE